LLLLILPAVIEFPDLLNLELLISIVILLLILRAEVQILKLFAFLQSLGVPGVEVGVDLFAIKCSNLFLIVLDNTVLH
jgi:hypothetical protein